MFFFVQMAVCVCCVAPAGCTGGSCYFIACGSSGLLVWMASLLGITMGKHFLELPEYLGCSRSLILAIKAGVSHHQKCKNNRKICIK